MPEVPLAGSVGFNGGEFGSDGFDQSMGYIRAVILPFIRALVAMSAETSIEPRAHIRADLRDLLAPS